jgi:hypothetical protein
VDLRNKNDEDDVSARKKANHSEWYYGLEEVTPAQLLVPTDEHEAIYATDYHENRDDSSKKREKEKRNVDEKLRSARWRFRGGWKT